MRSLLIAGWVLGLAGAANAYERPTLGAPGAPVVDGAVAGWGAQHLIATGLANDDPRSLGDHWSMHETPWDLTHLYAAWDDDALYLAWQYVDVTDVIDPNNAGSSAGTAPNQMDLIQWVAFDTRPGTGSALDMWGKNSGEPYWTGDDRPDVQLYVASNLWQGYLSQAVDGVFQVDDGGVHYFSLEDAGVTVAFGDGVFAADGLPGVNDADDALGAAPVIRDFLQAGHDTGRDTFYELRVPLAVLGLDRAGLEANGLGVMIGQGEGSCLDTLPHDPATLDTVGVSDSNSPLEWADVDRFTVPFARVATAAFGAPGPESDGGAPPGDLGVELDGALPDQGVAAPDGGGAPADAAAVGDHAVPEDPEPAPDGGAVHRDAALVGPTFANEPGSDGCRASGTGGSLGLWLLVLLGWLSGRRRAAP
ncbi:MAG: hypothetical protein KC613_21275 [Myxococcales bacterium]|nr:hypothetical protein [Myxococcales bacterium]